MQAIRNVLIVGGGAAGWLAAGFLARQLGDSVRVTLVESKEIGIIGVGEGTFPSIRGTLSILGIDEGRFIRECRATFKQGVNFRHWVREPGKSGADHYFHPFSQPSQRPGGAELLPYWLQGAAGGAPFAGAVTLQKAIADASHAPKRPGDADYTGPLNYAYHFDAASFAALLSSHAQSLGVRRIEATVDSVQLNADGSIASLTTREAGVLAAELFVDCSGFRALLIGEALGSPFRNINDTLFVDRALALQVPYARPDAPIASYTISTAHEAGWTWDIGLHDRRGTGYVYSSRHSSDERAEQVLRAYVGAAGDGLSPRLLKLNVGYRETQWVKNCVAIGLSGGFLEPLESSGIGLIEAATYMLSYLFPYDGNLEPAAKFFNEQMRQRYEKIVDFVKMHYCLTQRTSDFWVENTLEATIPESLREKLGMWRSRPPHRLDFITDVEMYPPSSWQYVLYGMEFRTTLHGHWPERLAAEREFRTIREVSQHALRDLPSHRALIDWYLKGSPQLRRA